MHVIGGGGGGGGGGIKGEKERKRRKDRKNLGKQERENDNSLGGVPKQ